MKSCTFPIDIIKSATHKVKKGKQEFVKYAIQMYNNVMSNV